MAKELEAGYAQWLRERTRHAVDAPAELAALDARIARLRERLQTGEPDLTWDELQAAISRVEAKRDELRAVRAETGSAGRVISMLPRAAGLYRKQIEAGLDGDPVEATKARAFLAELLGPIELPPGKVKGELWASYRLNPACLVKGIAGISGRGDRI